MSKLLGLVEALEATILESFKIPMSRKTIIDEDKVLDIIDKMRELVKSGENIVATPVSQQRVIQPTQMSISRVDAQIAVDGLKGNLSSTSETERATEIIEQAYKINKEVRMGADKYADEVLTKLEETSSRILRAVRAGRTKLGRVVTNETKPEEIGRGQ